MAGKGKGKAPVKAPSSAPNGTQGTRVAAGSATVSGSSSAEPARPPPMRNPTAGSANPAASFPALWGYLEPALDHIIRSPTNTPDKAPSIDVEYHMGIYTAVYNYFTMSNSYEAHHPTPNGHVNDKEKEAANASGTDLYEHLDRYYANVCRELLVGAPIEDSDLIPYLIPCFNRYAAGAQSIHRMLNYVNRHFVRRSIEEDRGWLRIADVLEALGTATPKPRKSAITTSLSLSMWEDSRVRDRIARKLAERRREELMKWGYDDGRDGTGTDVVSKAEASAEAASPPDRIVPLTSLALRRFRTEFVDPLLAIPKKKKPKKKKPSQTAAVPIECSSSHTSSDGNTPSRKPSLPPEKPGPKGRLARAVKDLLENYDPGDAEDIERRKKVASDLNDALGRLGIKIDQPLRKKLDKFSNTPTTASSGASSKAA